MRLSINLFIFCFIQIPKVSYFTEEIFFPQWEQGGRVAYDLHPYLKTWVFWVRLVSATSCNKQLYSHILLVLRHSFEQEKSYFSAMRLLRTNRVLYLNRVLFPLPLRIGDIWSYASLGVLNWTEGDALWGIECLWMCTILWQFLILESLPWYIQLAIAPPPWPNPLKHSAVRMICLELPPCSFSGLPCPRLKPWSTGQSWPKDTRRCCMCQKVNRRHFSYLNI